MKDKNRIILFTHINKLGDKDCKGIYCIVRANEIPDPCYA